MQREGVAVGEKEKYGARRKNMEREGEAVGEKEKWLERRRSRANNRFPDFLHRVGSRSAATDLLLIFATISIKSSILTGFLFLS